MDKTIYGILPDITDKDFYTNSFHIPNNYPISIEDKIKLEAPYHALTNGGHITCINLENSNIDFEDALHLMSGMDIGYCRIINSQS